ncbi:hypothetical protein SH661x_003001 [Planctomicrobium sp. SH661]|uniref:hypothetical protein n=1 Tax=Planctomicrobium sp. SH661 TaxID=3448124 RepID=UPI003F5AE8BC
MMECAAEPYGTSEFTFLRIADAVRAICDGYGRACRRLTGRDPRKLEFSERRGSGREGMAIPFYLSVLFQSGERYSKGGDSPIIAVTRDISERGIGFRCDTPIPNCQLIAEFDNPRTGTIRLLLEVRWHRRHSLHCYLAGARIVRVLDSHEFA